MRPITELPVAGFRETFGVLREAVRPQRWLAAVSTLIISVSAIATLAVTLILGRIVDQVQQGNSDDLNVLGVVLIADVLVAGLTAYVGRMLLARVVEGSLQRLRSRSFDRVIRLRLDTVERVGTSDPLSRLTADVNVINDGAHDWWPLSFIALITCVFALVVLVFLDPLLGVAAMAGLPVLFFGTRWFFKNSGPSYEAERAATVGVARFMHEIAVGASTLRNFRQSQAWLDEATEVNRAEWSSSWGPAVYRSVLYSFANVSQAFALTSVLLVGAFAYSRDWLSIGTVSAGLLIVVQFYGQINRILDSLSFVQSAVIALTRVSGLAQLEPEAETEPRIPSSGSVVIDGVHFGYIEGEPILRGISFSIADAERIAIVGPSGAGKSTVAKLIAGVHEVWDGSVTVGGVPVALIANSEDRRSIALVTQETHLFIGSVADNCRLSRRDATDAQVQEALESVHAWSWVDALPNSMHTAIGSGARSLTLVQAQQLALARVLLADPRVVILDEATAGLGSDNARDIERAFNAVLEGRTVITIAHRLDVAASADRVVVMDHGRVEAGTHDELLSDTTSTYARLWNHWEARRV